MRRAFFRRGQNLVDLALIIGVVGLVFVGMNTYIQRSVQGKVKDLTDYIISDKQSTAIDAVGRQSELTLDTTMKSDEFKGGGRRLTGSEDSISTYITGSTLP
ncbi:MAG: hypothetical protein Q8N80_06290 [Candidatus Omnitrophota bacterium]|nr:hypothetical protein [Candidatus Omnitrophota bacterium]